MDEQEAADLVADEEWIDGVDRAVLSDSPEGRAMAAAFIATFGDFISNTVRPVLRGVADAGGEPQLLVNGLAQMLRDVAECVEFPVGETASSDRGPGPGATGDGPGAG